MTMISYAQNGEDVVLARALEGEAGFYVDVGASDPVVDSVTKHFYDRGWHGINVEPARLALKLLGEARPRDINLGVGLAAEPGELIFFELPQQMTGCSTFSAELAREYREQGWEPVEHTVELSTLARVCAEHAEGKTIDFIKIDVEGREADVLAGADFDRYRPRILVVEATEPGTATASHDRWEQAVLAAGYRFALFDGLNRFYAREDELALAERLAAPASTLDDYVTRGFAEWRDRAHAAEAQSRELDGQLGAARETIEATRDQLAASQAELRDARVQLVAARAALDRELHSGRR